MAIYIVYFDRATALRIKEIAKATGQTVGEWTQQAALEKLDPAEPDLEYDGGQP